MANPQWENGFIKMATEIWEALTKTRIPGEAMQVLMAIIRKTYGWNKKEDFIAHSQIAEMTGLKKQNVERAIKRLIKMNMITAIKYDGSQIISYSLNKDYETWKPQSKKITTAIKYDGGTAIRNDDHNIQLINTTTINKLPNSFSNAEIHKKIKMSLGIN